MNTIKLGNQEWMAENLNVTDGDLGIDHWNYNNNIYYSLKAAIRIAKKVEGFHLPTAEEWQELAESCGCVYKNNNVFPTHKVYNNIQELENKLKIKRKGLLCGNREKPWSDYERFEFDEEANFWILPTEEDKKFYESDSYAYHVRLRKDKDTLETRFINLKRLGFSVRLIKD